jgi:hypothetical protein
MIGVLTLATSKGGAGKSALARSLAAAGATDVRRPGCSIRSRCRGGGKQIALEPFVSSRALRRRTLPLVPLAVLAWPVPPSGAAEALEFAAADIFYELNATDGDLGVHAALDAESWRELRISDPAGRTIIEVKPEGDLKEIGLTELSFEGEEPPLAEVPFARLRSLFPEGDYVFLARTTDGQELRSTDPLTAELPCPVIVVSPAEDQAVPPDGVVVSWQPAPGVFDPDTRKCDTGEEVGLVGYQVIVLLENEEAGLRREFLVDLPPGVTKVPVPVEFVAEGARVEGTEFTLEVLAVEDSGNRTITARGFQVE